jgi:hypothetical protein
MGVLPMPYIWWEYVTEKVALPWLDWRESTVSIWVANLTAYVPSLNVFNAQYNTHVFRWSITYSMWHVPVRIVFWALAFSMLVSSARSTPLPCPVGQFYDRDRFSPIDWQGPLPLNCVHSFGLPGTVSERKLNPLAKDCGINISEIVDDMKESACKLYATGIVFGTAIPVVYRTCQVNMVVAVVNRQLAIVPLPVNMSGFDGLTRLFTKELQVENFPVPRNVSFEEWNSRFPASRAGQHVTARDELKGGCAPSMAKICERKSFSKVEKLLIREDKDPRCISGATDWWNVIFGPWFLGISWSLKKVYNYTSAIFYATSTTSSQLGSWFDSSHSGGGRAMCGDDQISILIDDEFGVVYAEGDGSRHDSHMHYGFWKLKWYVYVWLAGGWQNIPKSIKKVIKLGQEETFGSCKIFGIAYWHPYRLRSGDCDTSIGNTVCTDFVAWFIKVLFAACRKAGMTLDATAKHIEVQCRDQLGYSLKLNLTRDVSSITFLSGIFLPVGEVTYWCPLPGRLMARLGTTLSKPGRITRYRDLAGTINSFKAYKFVPFLRVYLAVVSSLIPEQYRLSEPKGRDFDYKTVSGDDYTPAEPSADTWAFFEARYGLSQAGEAAFRVSLAAAKSIPFMIRSHEFDILVSKDVGW